MRVLVTGATGRLGRALLPQLVGARYTVRGMSRRRENRRPLRVDCPGSASPIPKPASAAKCSKGVIKPWECKVFGTACTPETPIGAWMVSLEGACAAYYNFGRLHRETAQLLGQQA